MTADGRPTAAVQALGAEVRSSIVRLYRRFRSEITLGELGDGALTVLTVLQRRGPHTLTALSEHERVTPASMSQIVNRLASAGYVVRGSDSTDGRKVLFSVTPEGAELAIQERTKRHAWFDSWLQGLTDADRETLARAAVLLQEIADS